MPPVHEQTPAPAPETPAERKAREDTRKRRELIFAAFAFLLALILTMVLLEQSRTGDSLFVVIFQINFVLLLGIMLVVLRNGFKLLLERRRKVLGSRLRTRLVAAFAAIALLPCLLMFLVTTKYVQLSMDFWFKEQMENSMEAALEAGRLLYEGTGNRLLAQAENIRTRAAEQRLSFGGRGMDSLLEQKRREYRLASAGFYLPGTGELVWHAENDALAAWQDAKKALNLESAEPVFTAATDGTTDFVFAALPLPGEEKRYLVLAEGMGADFKARMDRIKRGAKEYRSLRNLKQPLKLMLYSSLGVLSALIMLGAVWVGFRVAREFSAPIAALALGTQRIAKGDLSVRLEDSSTDEFGLLIRSFNHMAGDLEQGRLELTSANALLEEQNLRTARHSSYIETVLDNIAAGVLSFDENGIISTANRAACDILGMERSAIYGRPIEDILPAPHAAAAAAVRERFRSRQESRSRHNISITLKGEERRLLINIVGFSVDGVYRGSVAVFEDISDLERMQRMAAWREVARRIAHEIKNPLTPIKLSAQRLERKFGREVNDPAFSQSTELIVRQVEHLLDMVQEFSAFAKLPEVTPKPDRLEPLLESLTALFQNSHSGITWKLNITSPLPELPMDKDALHRAFMNLYTNAAEALVLSKAPNPAVLIQAECLPELNIVKVEVADNGPGLTEEERSRLFEPYFSHKKGGTGLGLTIVRSIVSDHRGYVRTLPREGGGTVMVMELPLS